MPGPPRSKPPVSPDLEDFQGEGYFAGSNFKLTPFMQ